MGEAQDVQLHILDCGAEDGKPAHELTNVTDHRLIIPRKHYMWWLRVVIYAVLVLVGQAVATLLGKLYFDKGGKSTWMATLVQPGGFPILLPLYFLSSSPPPPPPLPNNPTTNSVNSQSPFQLVLASVYVSFGILLAVTCLLYSLGYLYLPVSTFSLICASQLGFNALFSFFFNSMKLTPLILNSLVLLTISSTLLVFQGDSSESKEISEGKYALGFICTVGASAGYALMLSLTQLAFKKFLKQESFKVVLDMIIYPSLVSTLAVVVGLFVSGEWKSLRKEMEGFELGEVSYLMTLIWTAICWQGFSIGCIGLILEVSSLFSNVISTLGLPVVPILAVFVFGDKMNGIKVVALLLAVWGFLSYIYQHYLDDFKSKNIENGKDSQISIQNQETNGINQIIQQ